MGAAWPLHPAAVRNKSSKAADGSSLGSSPHYLPIPRTHGDLRYEREKEKIQTLMAETREPATVALREEFAEIVRHMVERLSGEEDGKPKKFKNSISCHASRSACTAQKGH